MNEIIKGTIKHTINELRYVFLPFLISFMIFDLILWTFFIITLKDLFLMIWAVFRIGYALNSYKKKEIDTVGFCIYLFINLPLIAIDSYLVLPRG